jgi:hypothetical protein
VRELSNTSSTTGFSGGIRPLPVIASVSLPGLRELAGQGCQMRVWYYEMRGSRHVELLLEFVVVDGTVDRQAPTTAGYRWD